MKGVYQHCAEKHLHRYLAEFDFRYSNRIALGVDDGPRRSKSRQLAARAKIGEFGDVEGALAAELDYSELCSIDIRAQHTKSAGLACPLV
jgi:hypothetical protein